MKRRDILKKVGVGAAAAAAATVVNAPYVHAKPKVSWKMVSTWGPKFPYLQTGLDYLASLVDRMSEGQFKIRMYAGGELVPPMEAFEAVSNGTVEGGAGASYYWAGKSPAAQWFAAVPFGMNAMGMNAWFHFGNGKKLWEETYAPFNLIPRPYGNTGVQMGGWFNKKIDTIEDFKGLKMRIPGLGGKVVAKAGGTVVLTPGSEIFTSLERGVIDATEWVGPLHDKILGLYKVAKYYYYPGWHEPGTVMESFFNKKAVEALPKNLQDILWAAVDQTYNWMVAGQYADNGAALQWMIQEQGVNLERFSEPIMEKLREYTKEVLAEITAQDPLSKKVNDDFQKFAAQVGVWGEVGEKAYYDLIAEKFTLKKS